MICAHCAKKIEPLLPIGRRDACPLCDGDLHVCLQCRFHEPGAHNDCRETRAERVVDKERSNFCDWFEPGEGGVNGGADKDAVKAQLDALFEK